jgi:hypothetical protein
MNKETMTVGKTLLEYTFIVDPSHAWLRVSLRDLEFSLIKNQISKYSYKSGSHVYLEEDCDAPKFLKAMEDLGFDIRIQEKQVDNFFNVIYANMLTAYR